MLQIINLFDKINKFRLMNSTLVRLAAIFFKLVIGVVIIILLILFFSNRFQTMLSNSGFVVIIASILGATVGGVITYIINTRTILLSNHMKSSIVNKKVIYEPLFMEYKNILEKLKESNDTLYFSYDANFRTIGSTPYEVWKRIENDTRIYQIPEFYRKECQKVNEKVNKYCSFKDNIQTKTFEIFVLLLNEKGYKIEGNVYGIQSLINVNDLLIGKNNLLKEKIAGVPIVDEKDKEFIISNFEFKLRESKVIDLFNLAKVELINSLEEAIHTTEAIIVRISNEFERKNNIY